MRYAEAQIALIDRTVAAALARRFDRDKPVTRELRGWRQSYERFVDAMRRGADAPVAGDVDIGTEAYLGLDPLPAVPVVPSSSSLQAAAPPTARPTHSSSPRPRRIPTPRRILARPLDRSPAWTTLRSPSPRWKRDPPA